MELIRCHIESFGNLRNFDCDFKDGLNGFLRENGWGKSTFAGFITAMFYGFADTRKNDPDKNPYKKFDPWDGGAYGGSVDFRTADGEFRIERFAGSKSKGEVFELTDLKTGKESNKYSENVGLELFGVDRAVYECSAFIVGGKITAEGEGVSGITERLSGLMDAVEDMNGYDAAMERLEERRKYYERTGRRGRLAELDEEIAQTERDIETAKLTLENAENLEKKALALETECKNLKAELDGCREKQALSAKYDEIRRYRENISRIEDGRTADEEKYDGCAGFFKGNIPDREQLAAAEAVASQIREMKAGLSMRGLSADDEKRLAALGEKYFPDEAELDGCVKLINECNRLEASLAGHGLSERETETLKIRAAEFSASTPDFEEIKRLQSELENTPGASDGKTAKKIKTLNIISLILAAIGIGCAIPGLIVMSVALIFAGLVLFIGGGAAFLLARTAKEKSKPDKENRSRAENSLIRIFNQYGMDCPDGSFARAADRLAADYAEYARLTEANENYESELRAVNAEVAEKKRQIARLLKTDSRDVIGYISQVRLEKSQYSDLATRKSKEDAHKSEINGKISECRRALSCFFGAWYTVEADCDFSGLCADMGRRLAELDGLKNRLDSYESTLKNLSKPDNADAPIPEDFPDSGTLTENVNALQTRLELGQNERGSLEKQIESAYEACACLPDLESKRERLIYEKQDGEKRLKAVKTAEDLLEGARNNLSSRYLEPMKAGFAKYFAKVSDGMNLEFSMDTSFKVSLRMSGQYRKESGLSIGWRDAVGLCIRFAFIDALYTGEHPVIILDDPFANLDAGKLANCLGTVSEFSRNYQIMYFTCSRERMPEVF